MLAERSSGEPSTAGARRSGRLCQRPFVRVIWGQYEAVTGLAARPLRSMTPADLATATAAKRSPVSRPAAWPFLDLLRTCLELRFATDVGLAETRPAAGGDDDVGLAADEAPG